MANSGRGKVVPTLRAAKSRLTQAADQRLLPRDCVAKLPLRRLAIHDSVGWRGHQREQRMMGGGKMGKDGFSIRSISTRWFHPTSSQADRRFARSELGAQ